MSVEEYAWSLDGEQYHAHGAPLTREQAIAECLADGPLELGRVIYLGKIERYSGKSFTPDAADSLIEEIQEQAFEEAGDVGHDWLENLPRGVIADLSLRLVEMINDWLTAHNRLPYFWTVDQIEEYEVPEPEETEEAEE